MKHVTLSRLTTRHRADASGLCTFHVHFCKDDAATSITAILSEKVPESLRRTIYQDRTAPPELDSLLHVSPAGEKANAAPMPKIQMSRRKSNQQDNAKMGQGRANAKPSQMTEAKGTRKVYNRGGVEKDPIMSESSTIRGWFKKPDHDWNDKRSNKQLIHKYPKTLAQYTSETTTKMDIDHNVGDDVGAAEHDWNQRCVVAFVNGGVGHMTSGACTTTVSKRWFRWQQSGEAGSILGRRPGDKATRRSVPAGVIMRGGHCLKVWTKKQQVVALSSAESEMYAAVKTATEGLGIQSVAKDLGITCRLNLHLDASATLRLVNRRGLGKAKHVDIQSLWIQEASKSNRFATKKIGTSVVNPADLMTKPLTKQKIEQFMSITCCEFLENDKSQRKNRPTKAK